MSMEKKTNSGHYHGGWRSIGPKVEAAVDDLEKALEELSTPTVVNAKPATKRGAKK